MFSKNKRPHSSGQDSVLTPERKIRPTIVTPQKDSNMEEKMDTIIELVKCLPSMKKTLEEISETLTEHQKAIEYTQGEVADLKQQLTEQEKNTKQLKQDAIEARAELNGCKADVTRLKEEMVNLEAYSRRDNLIFLNIEEGKNENCMQKISNVFQKMKVVGEIKFSRVHRLGQFRAGNTRAIVVRFHYPPDREQVWRARSMLKGTRIIVKEDYPEKIATERQILQPIYKQAIFLGQKAKMVKESLIVEGKRYKVKDIDALPEELQPRNICEKKVSHEDKDYLLFAGKDTPLSNWFLSTFTIDGITYSSSEQFYAYNKANFAEDIPRATQIIQTTDTRRIKYISKGLNIVDKQEWRIKGTDIMKAGLRAKFEQNEELKQALLETSGLFLVECTRDKTWGCGVPLYSKEASKPSTWEGQNLLGQLLMELRTNL